MKVRTQQEIWHKKYNINNEHNLDDLPSEAGVFGLFAMIDGDPVNCRLVGQTENIGQTILELFDTPNSEGLKHFMQGPWISLLQYTLLPKSSVAEREELKSLWIQEFAPKIEDNGEYPGYYKG